jgi:hypothetical protein
MFFAVGASAAKQTEPHTSHLSSMSAPRQAAVAAICVWLTGDYHSTDIWLRASWIQIVPWLRQIDGLRRVA